MKRPVFFLLCALAWTAQGHVGSPNVFFEGQAGAQPVRVVIRPPRTLPGAAQIDVQLGGQGTTNVLIRTLPWDGTADTATLPVQADWVPSATNHLNAALWLFGSGAYKVHLTLENSNGTETLTIPLSLASTRQPGMTPTLIAGLTLLGVVLVLGAIGLGYGAGLSGFAARPIGLPPTQRERRRARWSVALVALTCLAGLVGGAERWRRMDRDFRSKALDQPRAVTATLRTNGTLRLLHLTRRPSDVGVPPWDGLIADHGKLMHLFLVRAPELDVFAHLHPVRRDGSRFENVLPTLPAGRYQLYGEVTYETGLSLTLISQINWPGASGRPPQRTPGTNMLGELFCQSPLPAPTDAAEPFALDADDSWHLNPNAPEPARSPLMGGGEMRFQSDGDLVVNRERSLRFGIVTADGQTARLEPYMGMLGHAVVRLENGEVFTHLHPFGTISMAAQERVNRSDGSKMSREPASSVQAARYEVAFPYAFPRVGLYRIWVQVRTGGRVYTGVFAVRVRAESEAGV